MWTVCCKCRPIFATRASTTASSITFTQELMHNACVELCLWHAWSSSNSTQTDEVNYQNPSHPCWLIRISASTLLQHNVALSKNQALPVGPQQKPANCGTCAHVHTFMTSTGTHCSQPMLSYHILTPSVNNITFHAALSE